MMMFDNPEVPLKNRAHSKKFIAALKTIYRGGDVRPIQIERITEYAGYYEHFAIRDFNMIAKTTTPHIFFSYLKESIKDFREYLIIRAGGIILTEIEDNEIFKYLKTDMSVPIGDFITRSFDYDYRQAQNFKTKDGRNNFMRRYFKSLKEYEEQMCPENIQRLKALELIIEANGVEPRPTRKRKKAATTLKSSGQP